MRKMRSDTENLRDTRIAYTFLISLSIICLILGLLATSLSSRLQKNELADCRNALTLCSDALREWGTAESGEDRYAAAIRFATAAASLPSEVELEPLLTLSKRMYSDRTVISDVNTYADTFSLLAALEYTTQTEARDIIVKTLSSVSTALYPTISQSDEAAAILPPEVLTYTKKTVIKSIRAVFGSNALSLEPVLNESGNTFTAESENLRMSFSASNGCLDSFIHIRVGDSPTTEMNESERIAAVRDFFDRVRHRGVVTDITKSGELCGFLLADITAGGETYRAAVDRHGRVWSITKVKR